MKKFLAIISCFVLGTVISACSSAQAPTATKVPDAAPTQQAIEAINPTQGATDVTFIGEEKAEEIALAKAGLKASDVTFINIDLDRDDSVWKYELEFRQGKTEYEADINAIDGTILKWEMDTD